MPSVDELNCMIGQLRTENEQLKALLRMHGIEFPSVVLEAPDKSAEGSFDYAVTKRSPMPEKIALFRTLFQGRPDIYARRWESKTGRIGYSPVCKNEWQAGICLKPCLLYTSRCV